jgi:anaerobic dimethyl sulfoxide reductase subunit C (anchor subunit)
MPQNAWSLLVFTLLAQTSVGAFCFAELLNISYSREFGFKSLNFLRFFTRLFVLTTAILAGVSSIFHLKNWARAYFAFNNLKTSWVSKEMMLFLLYLSCVVLLTFISWRKIKVYILERSLSIVGIFGGLALIYSMAKIYMLPTIPVWDSWTTPGFFSTAALLLGCLSIICLYRAFFASPEFSALTENTSQRWSRKTLPNLVKLSMIVLVLGILVSGFFVYRLIFLAENFGAKASLLNPDNVIFFFLSILFYVLGWILLLFFLKRLRQVNGVQVKSFALIYAAFFFIALAEIAGRYLFFLSFYRVGL